MPLRAGFPTCAGSQPSASPAARGLLSGLLQIPSSLGAASSMPQCAGHPPQWDGSQKREEEVGCCGVISGVGKAVRSMVLLTRPEPLPCRYRLAGWSRVCCPRAIHSLVPSQPLSSPMVSRGDQARQQAAGDAILSPLASQLDPSTPCVSQGFAPGQRHFAAPSFPHAGVYPSSGSAE